MWMLWASYVAARLLFMLDEGVSTRNDTLRYQETGIDLTGGADTPWLMPLLFDVVSVGWFGVLQTVVSATAFVWFAIAVGRTLDDQRVRVAVMAVILLVGLSGRVVSHDTWALTESLAIALTLMLLSVLIDLRHARAWVLFAVLIPWTFVRDAHALIGVGVGLVAAVMLWRWRRPAVAAGVVVVALWGGLATQHNRFIEANNIATIVAFRADNELLDEFRSAGMPTVEEFERTGDVEALHASAEFYDWAGDEGVGTYVGYLLGHPGELASAVPEILGRDGVAWTGTTSLEFRIDAAFPRRSFGLVAVVLLAAGGAVAFGAARTRSYDRRLTLPLLVLASSVPHAVLVHHGSAIDTARHATLIGFLIVVAAWWLLALGVDRLVHHAPVHAACRSAIADAPPAPRQTTDAILPS